MLTIKRILLLTSIMASMSHASTARAQCEYQKLTASDAAQQDRFGAPLALSGNVMVVGAFNQGNPGNNLGFGKAYVFEFDGADWVEVAQLTPSDPQQDQEFGGSVAVDGHTIVVGASQDNGVSGAVYVFDMPAMGWVDMTETAKLTASDASPGDAFGGAVGISLDVIVVGALNDQDAGGSTGSAYVFEEPLGGWGGMTETHKLLATNAAAGDRFGRSVGVHGNTIVVGADEINTGAGRACVFEFDGSFWAQTAVLAASDGAAGNRFGLAVAIHGDTIAVGAFGDDVSGSDSGSAYVFQRPASGWTDHHETAKLLASDGDVGDNLGISVSINSYGTVLVGAYAQRFQSDAPGFAYLFDTPTGSWDSTGSPIQETVKLVASDGATDDQFGSSVSISDEWAAVGANNDDDDGDRSGSAYVFAIAGPDCNANDAPDVCDLADGLSLDCQNNGIPDECEWDSDDDGLIDDCDADDDDDGILDDQDNCPVTPNVAQDDLDEDNIGDECDADIDGDGIDNDTDNCPLVANLGQDDTDEDGDGDACDEDDDDDGVLDGDDNCALIYNPSQADADNDGDGDVCDGDLDGDGVDNETDNCPTIANGEQNDFDGDGDGDACDGDIDDDGVPTGTDMCEFTPLGELVDPDTGCSLDQLCPCAGPRGTTVEWKNHGKYVSCVAHSANTFVDLGLISENGKDDLVSQAAQSECGHKD